MTNDDSDGVSTPVPTPSLEVAKSQFLEAGRALAQAICLHDLPGAQTARERVAALRKARPDPRGERLLDPDWMSVGMHVAAMLACAELHAFGMPAIGGKEGRVIAVYPRRTPTFDPFPVVDLEVVARICADRPQLVREWVTARLLEQRRAADARGEISEVDMDDPAQAALLATVDSADRVPPGIDVVTFLETVSGLARTYYDIVCAPKAVPAPDPT